MTSTPPPPPAAAPRPAVALVAAVARNRAIGAGNRLLWQEPEDQRHFRRTTLGAPVIMGRTTWESLPDRFRPLPGRRNLVLSRRAVWAAPGAERFGSVDAALRALDPALVPTAFVIGGAQVYAAALPLAERLILTEIEADFEGDVYFPEWGRNGFEVEERSEQKWSSDGTGYRFVTYRRRR